MATAAAEAEAASQARRSPVLWSGRWPAVCGPPRVLPQRLCASACPRSCPVLWRTLSPVQTNFLSSAESWNQDGDRCCWGWAENSLKKSLHRSWKRANRVLATRILLKVFFSCYKGKANTSEIGNLLFSYLFICLFIYLYFIGCFICLHFKCYPLSWFTPQKLPIPSPFLLLLWGCAPTEPHTPVSSPSHSSTLGHRAFTEPLLPLLPEKAILCYICGWSHGSLHVYSLVGGLVPGSSGGLVGWCCSSYGVVNSFSSFSPFSNSSIGGPVLSPMVGCDHRLCTCQAVAEPLRRQLYKAPVGTHFLASTIVSAFGDCRLFFKNGDNG
jgi:hypothetical protein